MRKLKAHFSMAQVADLAGEYMRDGKTLNTQLIRRRLAKAGLLTRLPGVGRAWFVATADLREHRQYGDLYERALQDSRFWEETCEHPHRSVRRYRDGRKWCQVCGAQKESDTHEWELPLSAMQAA